MWWTKPLAIIYCFSSIIKSESYNIYKFFCGSKPRIVIFSLIIIVFSLIGLSFLRIDTSLVGYFPAKTQMRQDIDYVNDNFAGSNSVYFTISGENPGDIKNPEILKKYLTKIKVLFKKI